MWICVKPFLARNDIILSTKKVNFRSQIIKMKKRPLCPECDGKMNFIVAKLTEDEPPKSEDVKSGWYCPDCGVFRPSGMVGSIDLETLEIDVKEAVRVTSSAAIFIPDEWVLEDKTPEVIKIMENIDE
jgi:hypothetical protein